MVVISKVPVITPTSSLGSSMFKPEDRQSSPWGTFPNFRWKRCGVWKIVRSTKSTISETGQYRPKSYYWLPELNRTAPIRGIDCCQNLWTSLFAKPGNETDREQTIYTRKAKKHNNKIPEMHTNVKHSPERLTRHCEWHQIYDKTQIWIKYHHRSYYIKKVQNILWIKTSELYSRRL